MKALGRTLGLLFFIFISPASLWSQSAPACGQQLSVNAIYRGIPALSNDGDQTREADCAVPPIGIYGDRYQCVEYVKRFYSVALGFDTSGWTGNANTYYQTAQAKGLRQFANGGPVPPSPDDIVVFEGGAAGHVAIVTAVTQTQVDIIEQNWSFTGMAKLVLNSTGGHYTLFRSGSKYVVLGWLRVPKNPPQYVSLTLGEPGVPGDGIFVNLNLCLFCGNVISTPLSKPLPLAGITNGFTVTVFSPQLTQGFTNNNMLAIAYSNPSALAACQGVFAIGYIGWYPRGPVTVNGTIGFYADVQQQDLTNVLVANANQQKPGCNIVLNDLVVEGFDLYNNVTLLSTLDALAIGLSQDNFPGEVVP